MVLRPEDVVAWWAEMRRSPEYLEWLHSPHSWPSPEAEAAFDRNWNKCFGLRKTRMNVTRTEAAKPEGPYTVWVDYGYEGWHFTDCRTLEEALALSTADAVIQKPVSYQVVETNTGDA